MKRGTQKKAEKAMCDPTLHSFARRIRIPSDDLSFFWSFRVSLFFCFQDQKI